MDIREINARDVESALNVHGARLPFREALADHCHVMVADGKAQRDAGHVDRPSPAVEP